ncbi:MAG: hypothetical protein LBC61_05640 [Candidatus Peribacteria bacterium]|jgi:ABC-2 type transport system ATP-binding protein|nr:hypothetical protein [Candidatus Peribacteria bacterium]
MVATKFGFIDHGMLLKEVSHKELHKLMNTSLVVEVDNVEKAVDLLENTLKTKKYSINDE